MTNTDRDHLISNIVVHLRNASKEIQIRQTRLFYDADPEYENRVADGLGIELLPTTEKSDVTPVLVP